MPRLLPMLAVLLLVGCTSPGKRFRYRDVAFAVTPSVLPAAPTTADSPVLSFAVRNTWDEALGGVGWSVGDGTTTIASGTITSLAAHEVRTVTVTLPPQAAGTVDYVVTLDPGQTVAEDNEGNNTATLPVTWTDPPPPSTG